MTRALALLLAALGLATPSSFAQTDAPPMFSPVEQSFPAMRNGSIEWADIDNDGDLDLLLCGDAGGSPAPTRLYRNNQGAFELLPIVLPPYRSSTAQWGDIDNDGYVDLVIAGLDTAVTGVYRNLSGTNLVLMQTLRGAYDGRLRLGDYDQDGYLDLVQTGATFSGGPKLSVVYRNQAGTNLTFATQLPVSMYYGSADWADIDNDGDLDLLHTGEREDLQMGPHLYLNEGGRFRDASQLSVASGAMGQFFNANNDGWPDLFLSEHSLATSVVLTNTGTGQFVEAARVPSLGAFALGDADNDGFADALVAGYEYDPKIGNFTYGITRLYLGQVGSLQAAPSGLPNLQAAVASWADYDGDGALDVLLMGQIDSGYTTLLYHSNVSKKNTPPQAPDHLGARLAGGKAVFFWSAATDAEQAGGLNYNLRVGTKPGLGDIVSPMSAADGFRRVVGVGNAQYRTNYFLTGLTPGQTYYWSVQAIDNSYAGSAFAPEQAFYYSKPPAIVATSPLLALEDAPAEMVVELSDPDSPLSGLSLVAAPENGSAIPERSISIAGEDNYRVVHFTPRPDFSGHTRLALIATDEVGAAVTNVVTIYVVPVNDPPVAHSTTVAVKEDATVLIRLLAEDLDGDPLAFTVTSPPLHGALSGTPPDLYYTPETNYFGMDRFSFQASDGFADSHPAAVEITIEPMPDVPADQLRCLKRADGLIEIRLEGEPRQLYWLETSADLVHWEPVVLLDAGSGEIRVVDDPSQPMRFYHLRRR